LGPAIQGDGHDVKPGGKGIKKANLATRTGAPRPDLKNVAGSRGEGIDYKFWCRPNFRGGSENGLHDGAAEGKEQRGDEAATEKEKTFGKKLRLEGRAAGGGDTKGGKGGKKKKAKPHRRGGRDGARS